MPTTTTHRPDPADRIRRGPTCSYCGRGEVAPTDGGGYSCTECNRHFRTCRRCWAPCVGACAFVGEGTAYSICADCTTRAQGEDGERDGDGEGEGEGVCPDDPEGVHHVGCGCYDVDR